MASASRAVQGATAPPLTQPSLAQRLPLLLLGGVMLVAVGATGLLQVLQTSRLTTIGYELRALERERAALSARVRLLEAEIAQIARIDQVRDRAVEQLGMALPEETLRIAVAVPTPRVIPMPERYVTAERVVEAPSRSWWERLMRGLPGFD